MANVNFKKLNEDLISLVEKTIDPKFRDALKASRDYQTDKLQADKDYYTKEVEEHPESKWSKDNLEDTEELLKGKKSADYVYRHLADRRLEVDKATIEYIGSGKDLDGKTLKNKVKAKLPITKEYDEDNKVFVIADTHAVETLSHMNKRAHRVGSGFYAWEAYYRDGIFYLDNYMGNSLNSDISGRSLMKYLNNKEYPDWDFYLAFGPTSYAKRRERMLNKNPNDRVDLRTVDKWDLGDYDKSGYPILKMKDDLIRRLKEYKKNKGAYTQQVEEVQNTLNEIEPKIKEFMSNLNFRDFMASKKANNVSKAFYDCCLDVKFFVDEVNNSRATDETVNRYYKKVKNNFADLYKLLEQN